MIGRAETDSSSDDLVVAVARDGECPLARRIRRSAGDRGIQTAKGRYIGIREGPSRRIYDANTDNGLALGPARPGIASNTANE